MMNCPSRTDPEFPDTYNQNPNALNADATTRADLGYVANTRARGDHRIDCHNTNGMTIQYQRSNEADRGPQVKALDGLRRRSDTGRQSIGGSPEATIRPSALFSEEPGVNHSGRSEGLFGGAVEVVRKYMKFVGPGFMVAVAYIDPGKLSTSLSQISGCLVSKSFRATNETNLCKEIMLPMWLPVLLSNSSCSSLC